MDLYLNTNPNELATIFRTLNFEVGEEATHFYARLETTGGRFHAMFAELEGKVYCDLHFDGKKHKYFFGVDYKKKPREFFEKYLRDILENKNVAYEVRQVNWFTRRNRAMSGGFRL